MLSSLRHSITDALRRRVCLRGQAGQSLVVVVLAMFTILAIAAAAIDLAQWYQKHHQAQVSADASALAAANCLSQWKCTSTLPNGDAYNVATSMATNNQVPANTVQFGSPTTNGGSVTVTTATQAPTSFYLGQRPTVSAVAVASYTKYLSVLASVYAADCSNPTLPPATSSTGCTVNCATAGVTMASAGATNVSGAIVTNGSVNFQLKGQSSIGSVEYGDAAGSNCFSNNTVTKGGSSTILNGPSESPTFVAYPETFNNVWTSSTSNKCSNSSAYTASSYSGGNITATGSGTYPTTVQISGNSQTIGNSSAPMIICAGTIDLTGNLTTLNNVTLVANKFTFGGTNTFTITPASTATPDQGTGPNVAIYDTGTSGLSFPSNNWAITGVVYAPTDMITLGGNNTSPGFFEGNQVTINANNTAGGPSQTLQAFPGTDFLTQ